MKVTTNPPRRNHDNLHTAAGEHGGATFASRYRHTRVGVLALRVLLSAQFVAGGSLKLTADPQMVAMFDDIAGGQALRILVGVCELAGGIGLLVPRLFRVSAVALAGLMVGAAVTNVVSLQSSPVVPLVLLTAAVMVAVTGSRSVQR